MHHIRLEKLLNFLQDEPNDPFLKYALATEYLSANDVDQALYYYEDLISGHPDYIGTYYHLGKLYEQLDRKPEAIKIYIKGMEVSRVAKNMHAFSELQGVYNSAMGLDYEDD